MGSLSIKEIKEHLIEQLELWDNLTPEDLHIVSKDLCLELISSESACKFGEHAIWHCPNCDSYHSTDILEHYTNPLFVFCERSLDNYYLLEWLSST